MRRRVLDTNVLIVASGGDPRALGTLASHLETSDQKVVFAWLNGFISDRSAQVILDPQVLNEYRNKLSEQDYGLHAIRTMLDQGKVEYCKLKYDRNGSATLPKDLQAIVRDCSDRKFVALALLFSDAMITNACDTDWIEWEGGLLAKGIKLDQLLREWCEARCREKAKRKRKSRS